MSWAVREARVAGRDESAQERVRCEPLLAGLVVQGVESVEDCAKAEALAPLEGPERVVDTETHGRVERLP